MFLEDYFNNTSIFAVYGYSNAFKLYKALDLYVYNSSFYINATHQFKKASLFDEIPESFHIGLSCHDAKLYNYSSIIYYKNTCYSFVFDGSIDNKDKIIAKLEDKGVILQNYGNAYLFSILFLKAPGDYKEKIEYVKSLFKGNYNYLIRFDDYIIAGSSASPKKRLMIGKLENGGVVVSDNYDYFNVLNITYLQEINDNEIICIYDNQIQSNLTNNEPNCRCALNYIYTSNLSSIINNVSLIDIKRNFINYLGKTECDIVVNYPKDPLIYALEYENKYNIAFKPISHINCNIHTYIDQNIKDKNIVIIKENMSHINDLKDYIDQLYKRGAKEIHLKLLSPMLNYNCPYYMNDTYQFLMLFNETGIQEYLSVSSLEFLSPENFMLAIRKYDSTSKVCLRCIYKQ